MDQHRAEAIIHACHHAWSTRDLDRMLAYYSPDIVYTCNAEPSGMHPVSYTGRDAMRGFLAPLLDLAESVSVVEALQFDGVTARATVECYIKHYGTGIVLSSQYRQVIRFRDSLVFRLEEFHDAAKLATFWKLVRHTEAMLPHGDRER